MAEQAKRIFSAHGGTRWQQVGEIMACVSMGGWDFASRLQLQPLRDTEVTVSTSAPEVLFAPYPRRGTVGRFSPERVAIEDEQGRCLRERTAPGAVFRSLKQRLRWDEFDVLYYAGVLLWETLNLPFLLSRDDVELTELEPWVQDGVRWSRLSVRYPPSWPGLSQVQTFYSDAAGLLQRVDYGSAFDMGWLGLSQVFERHESFGGLVYPTRQTLYPRLMNGPLWRLTALVWIELDDLTVTPPRNAHSARACARRFDRDAK